MIACIWLPYFAARLERRDKPALEAPLVLLEPARGRIYALSAEAAQAGLEPGMNLRQGQALCPGACFIPASPTYYQTVREQLLETLSAFADRVELGEAQGATVGWLDVGAQRRAATREIAQQLGRAVREAIGLSPSLGLAGGKFPAWVAATQAKPDRALIIEPGQAASFLAPLPVGLLPLEGEMARQFRLLGLTCMGQVAQLPKGSLAARFGRAGLLLPQLARGHDPRPIAPFQPQAQLRETHPFDPPLSDKTILANVLQALADKLAVRLQAQGRVSREAWLYLALEDGSIAARHWLLRWPTAQADRLQSLLLALLAQLSPGCAVAEASVILTELAPALGRQLTLFAHGSGQATQLEAVMPQLLARYGPCFYWVSVSNDAARFPERRFRLHEVEAT